MTAADADRDAQGHPGTLVSGVIGSGKEVFKDTLVGRDTSGNVEPKDASGNVFVGVAMEGGAAGETIRYERKGIFEFVMAGAGEGTVGDELYAVDDQTVAATGTHKVGRAAKHLNAGKIFIDIGGYC